MTAATPLSAVAGLSVSAMTSALAPLTDRDWGVAAQGLDWSCRDTVAHVADDLFSYASQVIAQPVEGYLPVEASADPGATPDELLRVVGMCGEILRLAVEHADPGARGWHPFGTSDADGFAAMGAVEVLVHTYDVAQGLGRPWRPPAGLCGPVLERLFPQAPAGDPSAVLLHCTGREPLPGHDRLSSWRWDSSVPGDRELGRAQA